MNKLLGTTLMAAALTLSTGAALAADIARETRAVDARVTRIKLDGIVGLIVRQGAKPSLVLSGERDDITRLTTHHRGETLEIGTERRDN